MRNSINNSVLFFLFITGVHLVGHPVYALTKNSSPLFSSNKILNLNLSAPFEEMLKLKQQKLSAEDLKTHKFPGQLTYTKSEQTYQVPVEISFKGRSSLVECDFPKLEIKVLDKNEPFFIGNSKFDINTHCSDHKKVSSWKYPFYKTHYYGHREVAAYKILELFKIDSLSVRPIQIKYTDSQSMKAPTGASNADSYQGFILEDHKVYANRNNLIEFYSIEDSNKEHSIKNEKSTIEQYIFKTYWDHQHNLDYHQIAKIELFQLLIGNHDWFIKPRPEVYLDIGENQLSSVRLLNIRGFKSKSDAHLTWQLMPSDFNFSTISTIDIDGPNKAHLPIKPIYLSSLSDSQIAELVLLLKANEQRIFEILKSLESDPSYGKIQEYIKIRIPNLIRYLEKRLFN